MNNDPRSVDVLVLGGGASGSAAAWQAARLGARVLVIESSPWLGGMVSAAGVSALDGNEGALGSGFFGSFRAQIEAHYGGPGNVRTGWVSNTCFEPHIAARVIESLVRASGAEVWFESECLAVLREGGRVLGARIRCATGDFEVRARVTIEATETGDILELAQVPYRLGRDSRAELGEPDAPEKPDMELQDLTYVAILQRFEGRAPSVPRPTKYDPREFDCATKDYCTRPDEREWNHVLHDWDSFQGYGRLPNEKFMLNWPFHSNDSPADGLFGGVEARARCIRDAKARTLAFVHHIQEELGHPEWGLAAAEFGTADALPFLPYVRESRRVVPVRWMLEGDVVPVGDDPRPHMQSDAIAVGDYYLDHHHSKSHMPAAQRLVEEYPKNAPFQVPLSALVPREVDGLIVAEKSIGVSHIVNGCSRLQPVVMLIGQAAGAAAALSVKHGVEPRDLAARDVQEALLRERTMLVPMRDVSDTHVHFKAIQRLAVRGLIVASDPLLFAPEAALAQHEVAEFARRCDAAGICSESAAIGAWRRGSTRGEYSAALDALRR